MYNKGIIYGTRGNTQMKMGLIGYGSVGKLLIKLIYERKLPITVKYILKSDGGILNKEGLNLGEIIDENIKDNSHWIDNLSFNDLIDENIDYLVELTSTNIKTGEPALSFIKSALSRGINVVTGNKGPILLEYKNLKAISEGNGAYLGIGCTVGGALPSISLGEYGAAGAEIKEIQGVLNGTTNYILNAMRCENKSYEESLKHAQDIGIAEKNPYLDVEGYDTAIKTIILSNALMGSNLTLKDAEIEGITSVSLEDIKRVNERRKKIKLIGQAIKENGKVKVRVSPMEVDEDSPLFFIEGKNKGVFYKTDILGDITVIGGASSPKNAAASVLRDIYINEDWR